jgi:lysophospholipase L1-like esterase
MNSQSKYLTIVLVLSLLLNAGLGYKYIQSKNRYYPDYTFNRKELFEHLKVDSSSIVFMGNSLTAQFELAELFKNLNMRNRGVNGERSDGLLSRTSNIVQFHPKKVFIEIGINDIGQNIPKATLIENYAQILNKIQQGSPTTKIYVQSILPVYSAGPAIAGSGMNNDTIRDVNTTLEAYCKAHGITFIYLNEKFELNEQMNPKYCIADGLHLSGDGYLLWTEVLAPYVSE